ncbi:hypothetical protein [Pseudomonas chlororaphis]|uniref:Transglycosylase SLT domain-containing protein n=1 Tax=Pseudomonas chlororaphis subsp. aurantiaca TaxID=86192 RepID=A0AAJ0ZFQ9_9PSED|nr:hypothetical protein [Pseudomonas chlororaphis]MBU4631720.1 hypothetical protein [Pseudomonas chlororaphis subsp. aurantiaca]
MTRFAYAAVALPLILTGCATSPPANPNDICEIFREKSDWYKAAKATEEKWGVPIQVPLSIIYQESSFKQDALPPRKYLLWVIPWGRVTSAAGYPQAKDEVWGDYQRKGDNYWASRTNFADATDFIGWYMDQTTRVNGVTKQDAYRQYLNYHEGWGGYRQQTYAAKPWLQTVAMKVQSRSSLYGQQYAGCREELNRGFWSRFWDWL